MYLELAPADVASPGGVFSIPGTCTQLIGVSPGKVQYAGQVTHRRSAAFSLVTSPP